MADRTPTRGRLTLLQLAIAASAAVVPVLVCVLLAVASARDADSTRPARNADRHVSVRHVAALKTFERAIVRRDQVRTPVPTTETLLERLPQCRHDWDGHAGPLARARALLSHDAANANAPPAARIVLHLQDIDAALLAFSSGENRRVTDRVGLDGARWLEAAAAALETPVQAAEYPGRQFKVQCADIMSAVRALARNDGRMLNALAWRGTEVERVIARWQPEQYVEISPRQVARTNPWAGLPGCVYLRSAAHEGQAYFIGSARGVDARLCSRPEMVGTSASAAHVSGEAPLDAALDDPRWKIPPALATMLQPLETLRRPGGALYRAWTAPAAEADAGPTRASYGPNRIDMNGSPFDVGFSLDLTIDPELQALAQQTAACYTGGSAVCAALGMRRAEDGPKPVGNRLLERAMVRMAAVAVLDVESGRIEALAGAMSPCTRQEYDGPGRAQNCDRRLPYPIRYRPDALLNPAVFVDAMPASTIKPIMAAAFLSDPTAGARWLATEQAEIARSPNAVPSFGSLRAELMRSDSARFLDRMFCADRNFGPCPRTWAVQSMAQAFGWNAGCAPASDDCGKRDLLFGAAVDEPAARTRPASLGIEFGRLLVEPLGGRLGAPLHARKPIALDTAKVQRCASGPDGRRGTRDDWEKCGGGVVVDVVAEGWGQGHARATALGSAGMMATLAAAANGQALARPHLVETIRGVGAGEAALVKSTLLRTSTGTDANGAPTAAGSGAASAPPAISRPAASVILSGLSFGHRAGTSRGACEQVFDAKTCQKIDWIAGKTGTPTFPNDDRTLDDLAKLCASGVFKTKADRAACGPLRPYKWYVAAYRTDRNDPRWTKVIAVLTERNWLADTGRVHGAGDHGPNPAAEVAFQIAGRHVGALPWGGR